MLLQKRHYDDDVDSSFHWSFPKRLRQDALSSPSSNSWSNPNFWFLAKSSDSPYQLKSRALQPLAKNREELFGSSFVSKRSSRSFDEDDDDAELDSKRYCQDRTDGSNVTALVVYEPPSEVDSLRSQFQQMKFPTSPRGPAQSSPVDEDLMEDMEKLRALHFDSSGGELLSPASAPDASLTTFRVFPPLGEGTLDNLLPRVPRPPSSGLRVTLLNDDGSDNTDLLPLSPSSAGDKADRKKAVIVYSPPLDLSQLLPNSNSKSSSSISDIAISESSGMQ